jgi:hypothetical protein
MTTNNFPTVGKITWGRDFNFFQIVPVTATSFGSNSVDGYQPDCVITFPTYGVTFQLEGTGVIQYSFNGNTIHGDMTDGYASASLSFDNRVISCIWFQAVTGTPNVRVEAWGIR